MNYHFAVLLRRQARPRLQAWSRLPLAALLAIASAGLGNGLAQAQVVANVPVVPGALSTLQVPAPANLGEFVANKQAAIVLGKALFWDMQVGSDGKTACASCHFAAGADPRSKNQLSAGPRDAGLAALQAKGLNRQLTPSDFPFHRLADPRQAHSSPVQSLNIVGSSQGVFRENFSGLLAGQGAELRTPVQDPVFHVAGAPVRQVEPRNTPTVINAVFNLRNFWDGRAQTIFNGVNPHGRRDETARVFKLSATGAVVPTAVTLYDSSLASQASGPPGSTLEMSAAGRSFPVLGRKLLALQPLALQQVATDDSVLAAYAQANAKGLKGYTSYSALVKAAFKLEWWNGTQTVTIGGHSHSQMEANFSLFWGLALQLYQATLVSDEAPFDRWRQGQLSAMSPRQQVGLGLFMSKGKCINCHGGPAFTNAAISRKLTTPTERLANMVMGNGQPAVYDEGFYNIAVSRSADDPGVGGSDPFGRPLSFATLARQSAALFTALEGQAPNVSVPATTRVAVNGAFKTPTLRNVELTAPYFHNGSAATLRQVVEMYNRGGNFADNNRIDLDADIQPLGLSDDEIEALVDFMRALTDTRVTRHAAPFDHPELVVPVGQAGNSSFQKLDGQGRTIDLEVTVPPVGSGGYKSSAAVPTFLRLIQRSGLQAQYFNSADLSGTVATQRTEAPALNVLLGAAPAPGLSSSNWSVRWSGHLRAPATGSYTLTLANRGDDGVRLWLADSLVVDNWAVPSRTVSSTRFNANAGDLLPIRVEAWDQGASAQLSLSWLVPGDGSATLISADHLVPDEGLGLRAQYFKRADLGGPAVASRVEMPALNEGVGTTPVLGLGTSNWSVKWTGELRAPVSGVYTLQVDNLVDDGVRLWLDGQLAIDNWAVPSATTRSVSLNLQAGQVVPLRLDAWDADNAARVSLKWKLPSAATATAIDPAYLRP